MRLVVIGRHLPVASLRVIAHLSWIEHIIRLVFEVARKFG